MVGLTFASLMTWTILHRQEPFSCPRARRTTATPRWRGSPTPARSAEAQLAIGPTREVSSPRCVAAAMQEIRMSADDGRDGGIKERAASRFSDDRARRGAAGALRHGGHRHHRSDGAVRRTVRHGLGHHEQLHRHLQGADDEPRGGRAGDRRSAAGDRVGLAAAIPAVIIYNHFSRASKGYMDLVGRGSGAAGRLLSRDLDRLQRPIMRAPRGGGVEPWRRLFSAIWTTKTTISTRRTKSTSRPSST